MTYICSTRINQYLRIMSLKITFITLITCFSFFKGISQRFGEVVKWEANAVNGGKFFGITKTKKEAERIVNDIIIRNEKFKYAVVDKKFRYASIKLSYKGEDLITTFKTYLDNKNYVVLTPTENKALELLMRGSLNDAVQFYRKTENIKSEDVAFDRITELNNRYSRFMFSKGGFQLISSTDN